MVGQELEYVVHSHRDGSSSVSFRPKLEGLGVVAGPAVMYI